MNDDTLHFQEKVFAKLKAILGFNTDSKLIQEIGKTLDLNDRSVKRRFVTLEMHIPLKELETLFKLFPPEDREHWLTKAKRLPLNRGELGVSVERVRRGSGTPSRQLPSHSGLEREADGLGFSRVQVESRPLESLRETTQETLSRLRSGQWVRVVGGYNQGKSSLARWVAAGWDDGKSRAAILYTPSRKPPAGWRKGLRAFLEGLPPSWLPIFDDAHNYLEDLDWVWRMSSPKTGALILHAPVEIDLSLVAGTTCIELGAPALAAAQRDCDPLLELAEGVCEAVGAELAQERRGVDYLRTQGQWGERATDGHRIESIDLKCNDVAERFLMSTGRQIALLGEDRDQALTHFRGEAELVVLIDALDGSQHWIRRRNLYCTALSIFQRSAEGRYALRVSMVRDADGRVFFARADEGKAYVRHDTRPLVASGLDRTLATAHVATVARRKSQYDELVRVLSSREFPFSQGGLYTAGGNPALAALAVDGFDAVLELTPHAMWDWLPGAHVAVSSGCAFLDLDGDPVPIVERAESLLNAEKPKLGEDDVGRYVCAPREDLAIDIVEWLRGSRARATRKKVKKSSKSRRQATQAKPSVKTKAREQATKPPAKSAQDGGSKKQSAGKTRRKKTARKAGRRR